MPYIDEDMAILNSDDGDDPRKRLKTQPTLLPVKRSQTTQSQDHAPATPQIDVPDSRAGGFSDLPSKPAPPGMTQQAVGQSRTGPAQPPPERNQSSTNATTSEGHQQNSRSMMEFILRSALKPPVPRMQPNATGQETGPWSENVPGFPGATSTNIPLSTKQGGQTRPNTMPTREDFPTKPIPTWQKVLGVASAPFVPALTGAIFSGPRREANRQYTQATQDWQRGQQAASQEQEGQLRQAQIQNLQSEIKTRETAKPDKPENLDREAYDFYVQGGMTPAEARRQVLKDAAEAKPEKPEGVEQQEMADWLKKNPGKGPADFMKYKATMVPQYNFNLQSGGVGGGPLNPKQEATAQAIVEGRMAPPSSFALRTPYWQTVMGAVFERDPQFSEQRAQLRKAYTVGPQSKEINAVNTAIGHIGNLNGAIAALQNNDVRALNAIANRVGVETGKDAVTTFRTIVRRVGPEISKAYVGAGGSAEERGATEKDFDANLSPQQLRSNVSVTAKLLRSKIAALENQWEQNRAESMPSFQERFIMPSSKQTLDALSPSGATGGEETQIHQGYEYKRGSDGQWHRGRKVE